MSARPKYRAKPVYWDACDMAILSVSAVENLMHSGSLKNSNRFLRFDSTLEFHVYLKLVDLVGSRRILRQYPLLVIPTGYCYPTGKKWKADFAILDKIGDKLPSRYVEAKGMVLPEFCFQLAALEAHNKEAFNQLTIVFASEISDNKMFTRLMKTSFASRIHTLKRFQCISSLK